jgi:glycine cleavage system regulatory protein
MSVDIPVQYTHSVKLEETAQGIRVHVHVYANDRETAINQAIQTYDLTKRGIENMKILLAPMEIKRR